MLFAFNPNIYTFTFVKMILTYIATSNLLQICTSSSLYLESLEPLWFMKYDLHLLFYSQTYSLSFVFVNILQIYPKSLDLSYFLKKSIFIKL